MKEFIYAIINFAILAAGIFIFFRKTIINIFRTRRLSIEQRLDEAENIVLPEADEAPSVPEDKSADEESAALQEIRQSIEKKAEKLKKYSELECREFALSKNNHELEAMLKLFSEDVAECFRSNPDYEKLDDEKNIEIIDEILTSLCLTPGDMSYLRHHDVLYVTLTSARPLPEELRAKVEDAVNKLLSTVDGKPSLWVKVDPELIGGLSLRIGDTVYDGTIKEQVYLFCRELRKLTISEKDNMSSLLALLEGQIGKMKRGLSKYQLGRVISTSDGVCWMDGLADIMYDEIIEFSGGERGMILDIQKDKIGCVVLDTADHIESYTRVRRVGRIASVPAGEALLGRVVNALGKPIDGAGVAHCDVKRPIEFPAPAILDRASVSRPLHTGIKAIDSMIPIGRGQRELLVGDRQTGKTSIVIDTILNQRGKDVICVYVGIGQKESTISEIKEKLEAHGGLDYTIIVAAMASDAAALQYIAPFSGTAIAEYFMYAGKDVLIIYDDLSKHAVAYRELSLLLQRPSGREAYPGDIFYLHSRLLERSAQLSEEKGGGSITALPIIETQAGDISSYIPTNVISITDGQIFLEADLFHEGQRPAVNVGLSVSRVGGSAQTKLMKQVSSELRTKLAQYRELVEFTQFGADIDAETRKTLNNGSRLNEVLKQGLYTPLDDWKQALILFAVSSGYADNIELDRIDDYETALYRHFEKNEEKLTDILKSGQKLSSETLTELRSAIASFSERF